MDGKSLWTLEEVILKIIVQNYKSRIQRKKEKEIINFVWKQNARYYYCIYKYKLIYQEETN